MFFLFRRPGFFFFAGRRWRLALSILSEGVRVFSFLPGAERVRILFLAGAEGVRCFSFLPGAEGGWRFVVPDAEGVGIFFLRAPKAPAVLREVSILLRVVSAEALNLKCENLQERICPADRQFEAKELSNGK